MRILTSLAAAAAIALSLNASVAFAADEEFGENWVKPIDPPVDTIFDLGIDVAPIASSPAAVRAYLASLPAVTRNVLLATCEHYMDTPNSTHESETLQFCSIAVGG